MLKTPVELVKEAEAAMQAGNPALAQQRLIATWLSLGIPARDQTDQSKFGRELLNEDHVRELAEFEMDEDVIIAIFSRDPEPTED